MLTVQEREEAFEAFLEGIVQEYAMPTAVRETVVSGLRNDRTLLLVRTREFLFDASEHEGEYALVPRAIPGFLLDHDDDIQSLLDWCEYIGVPVAPHFYPEAPLWAHGRAN